MSKEWEYAGMLIEQFDISLKRIEPSHLTSYPAEWLAQLKKQRINQPSYTVYAWNDDPCQAVIDVYNRSHTAPPENPYKGHLVYITKDSGPRPYTLRSYLPDTKQHGRTFDIYCTEQDALNAVIHYEMELVQ